VSCCFILLATADATLQLVFVKSTVKDCFFEEEKW
jgi:hypothetical protein